MTRRRRLPWRALLLLTLVLSGLPVSPARGAADPPRMLHWGYWVDWDADSTVSLRNNLSALDAVIPSFYSLGGDGVVKARSNPEVVALATRAGLRVLPMVQNTDKEEAFSPVLRDPAVRRRAIEGLAALVRRDHFAGIHIDFESLRPEDRPGLSAFMAEMAADLHADGRLATIAVVAKTSDLKTSFSGAYDYAELGRSADFVVVMAYAFRTATSQPGPTAPIGWVDRVTAFAASQVPRAKLVLGVPLWGYDWNTTTGAPAEVRKASAVAELARRYNGVAGYSAEDETAWLRYRAGDEDHIVWYENARSLDAKLGRVAQKYGLAGFAGWRLGQEGPEAWPVLRAYRAPAPAPGGQADWPLANGRFFTQASGQPGAVPPKGYAVTDADGVRFWSEFQRLGRVEGVGYPASRRFQWDGFTTQVMQKAVFQWRPEAGGVYFVNVFDELSKAGKDDWLLRERSTPRPLPPSFDAGKSFAEAAALRLALLDDNPAIRARYNAAPDPLQLYGLPTSRVEDMGNAYVIRLQRAVIQQWKVDVPWAKAGQVTVANGGDVAKEAGMFGEETIAPELWVAP